MKVREDVVKDYIADFYVTEEYRRFSLYRWSFTCVKVLDRVSELHPELKVSNLRAELLDEVPQTLVDDSMEEMDSAEVDQDEALKDVASNEKAHVAEAPTTKALDSQPPPT